MLLKENRLLPDYNSLPWTGKGLLSNDYFRIIRQHSTDSSENEADEQDPSDNREVSASESEPDDENSDERLTVSRTKTNKKRHQTRLMPLPPARIINNFRTYIHFVLESALLGNSPGLYYKNAELIMFASIFKQNPEYIYSELRAKVFHNHEYNMLDT